MDALVVLKFGGSSVADNDKLNIVAGKIRKFYEENKKLVVVVSAQGKTTDNLISEAKSLSKIPNERELDVLLSTGEQISISKLAILLNSMKIPAISLTGWQAGIYTSNNNQNATIEDINTSRIVKELKSGKVVIVAGFQGINKSMDITTLGRGGSDTTAVAIAAKLKADHCYIYSDVDGVYTTDPKQLKTAKKINNISYVEMIDIANEGAKVLHNRCIEIGEKYNIPIVAKSTFVENEGTTIDNKLEETSVKSIVKNDNIVYVHATCKHYLTETFNLIYKAFIDYGLEVKNLVNSSESDFEISFTISKQNLYKLENLFKEKFDFINYSYIDISRISIIGNGIMRNNLILKKAMHIIEENNLNILSMEINESKIAIMFKNSVSDEILKKMHNALIN